MNSWTERILERAVGHLEKEGKTSDQAVNALIGVPNEAIDKVALKKKFNDKKVK